MVEKADLARSLQILSDERSEENQKLLSKLMEVKQRHIVAIKGSQVEIDALKI